MLPKTRLGKRSPLGALVCSSYPATEGPLDPGSHGEQDGPTTMGPGSGTQAYGRIKLHPGQKVYLQCGGRECCGVVEQHNHIDNQVSILLMGLGQHVLRKTEDVWTSPSTPLSSPTSSSSSSAPPDSSRPHPMSSYINVPRSQRSVESVDMDEMMAAMVLTSLSCSPVVQSPPQRDPVAAAPGMECGGGELSDSGSSGYWSVGCGHGSPAPSPPITETDGGLATPSDEGLDMELEQVLFDEPAPRKRRNSVKVAYRCLWPSCGKVLTSVVGIKRHVRTLHLSLNGEHERCTRSEEDFYYTEIHQRDHQPLTPPPTLLSFSPISAPGASWSGSVSSPPSPPAFGSLGVGPGPTSGAGSGTGAHSPTDINPQASPLSQSAPSESESFWQVQTEHSYQAPAPVLGVSPADSTSTSCLWTTPSTAPPGRQVAPIRVRSVSVGEQWLQQHSAPIRPHPASASPPRSHWTARRVRGEAKKCRKVYGIEHRDQWCTACRWKKACQRFLD